jgi:hypothetical protein
MVTSCVRSALLALLHLRLEDVSDWDAEFSTRVVFDVTKYSPVLVVISLDELKAPAAGDDIPPHEGLLDVIGERGMSRVAQHADSFLQRQVRGAAQAVEAVKQTAGMFGHFQRLGKLAESGHSGV